MRYLKNAIWLVPVVVIMIAAGCAEEHAGAPPTTGPGGGVSEPTDEVGPSDEALPPPVTYTLTVNLVSEEFGTGRVNSSPEGIQCPPDCSKGFDQGATIILSARPYPDVVLKDWEGCTEFVEGEMLFPDCKVLLDSGKIVTATFKRMTSPPPRTEPLELRHRPTPTPPVVEIYEERGSSD